MWETERSEVRPRFHPGTETLVVYKGLTGDTSVKVSGETEVWVERTKGEYDGTR